MDNSDWNQIHWNLIDTYFRDNPNSLVMHHIESYNNFFNGGINSIFRENNPVRFIQRKDDEGDARNEIFLYLGGKDGTKIYFGKPIIYDENNTHYMYPNDARLRNMTYGITIHYDVEIDFVYYVDGERKEHSMTLDKMYLGKFPIMLQSNLCILNKLSPEVRFNMGECRNDFGGYFIIDGKEKVIVPQEKFSDNMVYISKNDADDLYSHSAKIRSVSEDASKQIRTTEVHITAPSTTYSNNQIVVSVPNVRKNIPLFIVMRALGVVSDKKIIEYCLLDLDKNSQYIDLFIPSVHDANKIFNQETALSYIASFTKRTSISGVLDILMNYFLPHVGDNNFLDKAYFLGTMVYKMLSVYLKIDKPTDRDNFRFKRIELDGTLLYDLFREYYLVQSRAIALMIDRTYYLHTGKYKDDVIGLIEGNYREFFKERIVETGLKKGFKGNWGSQEHTKRLGIVQDLNRLSWYTFISHLRKISLPLDASAKVVGPRLLNSSQWGFIDPVDTPDGGNIGIHKHMAISTIITSGTSANPIIHWLRVNMRMQLLQECTPYYLANNTKMFVNGRWVGSVDKPIQIVKSMKLFRRNGIIPVFTSITFDYNKNEIYIFTDAGRLTRPIYYIEEGTASFQSKELAKLIASGKATWQQVVSGFKEKADTNFNYKTNKLYDLVDLYPDLKDISNKDGLKRLEILEKNRGIVDYIDTSEEENSLIATEEADLKKSKYYTNVEIDPSLMFGVMGNLIIFPHANPLPRNSFSCGQSKQAVSLYHSNYQMRIDKMGVVLNYGQIPLVKSRYLDYINKEQQPYGVNAIVAIMSYTSYNVEDAILINEGSIKRGLFRTSYYSMYEAREESTKVAGSNTNSSLANIQDKNVVGIKPGYDYSHLDKWGLVKENTMLDDKIVLIGKITSNPSEPNTYTDASVMPKKGQLGYVDKAFITDGEEGFRLAKIRVREERIPSYGDKMASRSGQKGTIGLIIPEEDMPYTADGLKPDLIINPHALPSRMTIGQLIESVLGIACVNYGGFGDCTAFATKGSNAKIYGAMLTKAGFHSSGNHLMYSGYTGEQLDANIYMGPTYYMRLKHMVKDKINYRARGPNTMLTRQPVQGRANDGGLRIGEMERDGIMAHGASHFLQESFLVRGDDYYMAVCNKTGTIAIYNSSKNIFLSPMADGPVKFHNALDKGNMNIENVSRFGRSFSILRIPYSFKLLIQELQVMNIQMRIITEDNVDQLTSMSYSNNIINMTKNEPYMSDIVNKFDLSSPTIMVDDKEVDTIAYYIRQYANNFNKELSKELSKVTAGVGISNYEAPEELYQSTVISQPQELNKSIERGQEIEDWNRGVDEDNGDNGDNGGWTVTDRDIEENEKGKEKEFSPEYIESEPAFSPPEEGTRVSINYKNSGNFYAGQISKDNKNGTFNVIYDNGETEENIPPFRIQKLTFNPASPDFSPESSPEVQVTPRNEYNGAPIQQINIYPPSSPYASPGPGPVPGPYTSPSTVYQEPQVYLKPQMQTQGKYFSLGDLNGRQDLYDFYQSLPETSKKRINALNVKDKVFILDRLQKSISKSAPATATATVSADILNVQEAPTLEKEREREKEREEREPDSSSSSSSSSPDSSGIKKINL